ncbi:uncharacterized protein TNCV_464661 [Trichonephila clavipes]|nr:uncharacterized protein TNCV_464661 [Trichonephila clavipes]
MTPHKPRKCSPFQDTDDEDMIVYDMAEQIETPKKNDKYFFSEEYWKNESWRQEGFLHVMTPTRVRNSQNSPTLPQTIKAGYLNCKIRPYIPNHLRCFKCQKFGHSQTACGGQLTCSRCASVGHVPQIAV